MTDQKSSVAWHKDVPANPSLMEEFRRRVQREWTRALVQALTEPIGQEQKPELDESMAPIEQLAAHAAADAWPAVERLVRPIFVTVSVRNPSQEEQAEDRPPPSSPPLGRRFGSPPTTLAPIVGITAHTLRRLARAGKSPIVVRRMGGRWWFSRVDL